MAKKNGISTETSKWKTTESRFVAFLDLLGFKDKVMRMTHQQIYEELGKISRLKVLVEQNLTIKGKETYKNCDVYVVSFSDSIVVFSKDDSFANFEYFLIALRAIFSNSIREKIALKGGFAHGIVSLNKTDQIYFGQPIIDAYLIEEDVNYLGVVAHSSIDKYLAENKNEYENSTFAKRLLFEDKTHLKSGKVTHLNLDWFILSLRNHDSLADDDKVKSIIADLNSFYSTVSGGPRRYIDNTKEIIQTTHSQGKINLKKLGFSSVR
jgi:hypothetical protein